MAHFYKAICKQCGHKFKVKIGGSMFFELLHCKKCGKEKTTENYCIKLGS